MALSDFQKTGNIYREIFVVIEYHRRNTAVMTMVIRYPFLFFFRITGRLAPLCERANYTAIGFSGHVSILDEGVAQERKLQPFNRFERWLLKPIIESEQKVRRECFRQAVIDVTGEDPDNWLL